MVDALHGIDGAVDRPTQPCTDVHLRGVRVRIDRAVAATLSDAELRRRIIAGLPAELDPPLAEAAGAELLRAVRRATRGWR